MPSPERIKPAILRIAPSARYIGVGRTTLHRWVRAGQFPEPIRLGENSAGYRLSTLEAFINAREHGHEIEVDGARIIVKNANSDDAEAR